MTRANHYAQMDRMVKKLALMGSRTHYACDEAGARFCPCQLKPTGQAKLPDPLPSEFERSVPREEQK